MEMKEGEIRTELRDVITQITVSPSCGYESVRA